MSLKQKLENKRFEKKRKLIFGAVLLILSFSFQLPLYVWASDVTLSVTIINPSNPECSDGLDNDSDGKIDYPTDAGCADLSDDDEADSGSSSSSSGGGGGGSGIAAPVNDFFSYANVIFSGLAYPFARVGVLKDGQLAVSTTAGADSSFNISLSNLSSGNYVFSVFAEDVAGRRSSLFSFSVFVTPGASTQASGIFVTPTIALDKSEVRKGDVLSVFGQSVPGADITVLLSSSQSGDVFYMTKADSSGAYLLNIDTALFPAGFYTIKSRSVFGKESTSFGSETGFSVGDQNVAATAFPEESIVDADGDGRVNISDFSILAYWYGKSSPPLGVDLNNDGVVNLIDLSILAFYWTG